MPEEGPYRGPVPPEPVKRVSTHFLFSYGYRRAQENASVETFRTGTLIVFVTSVLIIVGCATVPGALAHIGPQNHGGPWVFESVLLVTIACAMLELYIGGIWLLRESLKPSRERMKRWEAAFGKIRAFNSDCHRLRGKIARFDAASAKEKRAIVSEASDLAKRRPGIIRLTGANHD